MPPKGHQERQTAVRVRLRDFKDACRRVLPPGHPLRKILDETPDSITLAELEVRAADWLVLIDSSKD